MFKRILLIVCLMAVLVVPGAAETIKFPDSLSSTELVISGDYITLSGDVITRAYTYGEQSSIVWSVPTDPITGDFAVTMEGYPTSSNCYVFLKIYDENDNNIYGLKNVWSSIGGKLYAAYVNGVEEFMLTGGTGYAPMEISRTDGVVTLRIGDYVRTYDDAVTVAPTVRLEFFGGGYARAVQVALSDPVLSGVPYRTGTVTMTDHNGTTISGFDVTAINHYTDQEYTVTTDTDVAVMNLPMDRMTEIRNPQTGVYEEAPVGYYTFYGQKPGYKMLNEDGIKVVVTPVKYSYYQLCDILVTPESGYLTGKHKFQIKSRADNSILQTGTISAKSATTGEWYNTTVSGGIATLILPYDTTSILSEYAGLYYVYATSPGYEDSDYATQISVYPHTVSEIKTVLLTPIGGVSPPDNVTLRIQAVSETGTGVVNAEIFIAGVYGPGKDMNIWDMYTASSTGYLEVSVPGNSTYDIVASGDGFYDSARRIEVFTEDPGLIELKLYLSGYPTITPPTQPTQPTGWPTDPPTGGIPDEDDDCDGFLMQAVRSIANLFGVSFGTGKTILGMLLALGIGMGTAKQLKGGAQEFGMGMLGGVVLGVLIGLLPIWVLVLLVLIVGLWIGQRYMGGSDS